MNDAIFDSDASEIVLGEGHRALLDVRTSFLPFIGKAHVAYIPNGKVIGLSKVARIVDMFARRLQIQENLTIQIADALMKTLHPNGRRGGDRGQASLHDDARRGETELRHENIVPSRLFQGGRAERGPNFSRSWLNDCASCS